MKIAKQLVIGGIALSCATMIGTSSVKAATAIVNVESLFLREEASASSDMVDGLIEGQQLEVLEKLDGWYKVKADGEIGYVSAEFVTLKDDGNVEEITNAPEEKNEPEVKEEKQEEPKQEEKAKEEVKQEENKEIKATSTNKSSVEFKIKEATLEKDAKAYILPLINSSILKNLSSGTSVTIYDEVNNWYYIQDDEISGWVLKSAFGEVVEQTQTQTQEQEQEETTTKQEEVKNEIPENEVERKTMYVNSVSIYVRSGPGTDYEDIDSLELNNTVEVIAESGDWYKVEVAGKTGYIAKTLLSDSEQETTSRSSEERKVQEQTASETSYSSEGEAVVAFAKEYLGCPYVYGGSGPDSFDCSGFTMYVYKNFGVNLIHGATSQSRVGEYVAKEDLMPGDLVFFKDYETMEGIGHVGIYIGDGDFIHASSGSGYCVKISTLLSGSYDTRYETARRIL